MGEVRGRDVEGGKGVSGWEPGDGGRVSDRRRQLREQ